MKVLVWNMDYWKSSHRESGWNFIREIDPDLALLSECAVNDDQFNYVHHVQKVGWGVGVFSRHHDLVEVEFECCHPEAVAVSSITIESQGITGISLYGRIIDGFAITTLHRSLSDLTPLFQTKAGRDWTLIGGDFNASTQCDELMPSYKGDRAHHIFFERLMNFGLADCLKKFHEGHIRTLRHKNSDVHWHNDYLFVGKSLYDRCVSCEVIDDPQLYEVSDHNPIIAEFDLSK